MSLCSARAVIAAGAALIGLAAACAPLDLGPTPTASGQRVLIATSVGGGQLPTRPAIETRAPTSTSDLVARIATVAAVPTFTTVPTTPTATLVPAYTTTPRPSATPMSGSFIVLPTATRPAPTHTPYPTPDRRERPAIERPPPTETTDDPYEPNDTPDRATPLESGPLTAFIWPVDDVDVYRVNVVETNVIMVVSVSGDRVARYKVDIVAPRSGKVGRQRLDGTVALRAVAEIGTETGPYFVYVRGAAPTGPITPYTIMVEFLPGDPARLLP